jgi:hypothetical protein
MSSKSIVGFVPRHVEYPMNQRAASGFQQSNVGRFGVALPQKGITSEGELRACSPASAAFGQPSFAFVLFNYLEPWARRRTLRTALPTTAAVEIGQGNFK